MTVRTAALPQAEIDARPIAHLATTADERLVADDLRPLQSWTMEATVGDVDGREGVLAVVSEPDAECVRALVVRRRSVGVVGWSWRGGQAFWSHAIPQSASPRVAMHVAAALDAAGTLILYLDGQPLKAFTIRGMFPGKASRQRMIAASSLRFFGDDLPGWRGQLRDVAQHDHALSGDQVAERARTALGLPEPAPTPPPAPRPLDPVGCEHPSHLPGWRTDGDRLRCLMCEPPRGCEHDEHERYWRPAGHDMRPHSDFWRLTCGACDAEATRSALTLNSGALS